MRKKDCLSMSYPGNSRGRGRSYSYPFTTHHELLLCHQQGSGECGAYCHLSRTSAALLQFFDMLMVMFDVVIESMRRTVEDFICPYDCLGQGEAVPRKFITR